MHGVAVADNVDAVEAFTAIGDSLDSSKAKVTVPGIEKVLTSSEMARFNALNSRERLLVALSVLGLSDWVQDAAAKDASLLSQDALALISDVNERKAAMTEEELAELTELLDGTLVKDKIVYQGKQYDSLTLEITVTEDGVDTHERYTFRDEDGQWILTTIEKDA